MKRRGAETNGKLLNVLVVDDSAVVRQVMANLLSVDQGMNVTVASDPLIAMEKMQKVRPDVIVLDLLMPRMDGLTFLRRIMAEDPIPVVVCSGVADRGTDSALRAMAEGAVEIVRKPKVGIRDFLYESAVTMVDAVRAAAQARIPRRPSRKIALRDKAVEKVVERRLLPRTVPGER